MRERIREKSREVEKGRKRGSEIEKEREIKEERV